MLEGQLNLQLNSVLPDCTPWRRSAYPVLNGSYYHCSANALGDKSKLLIVTTVMMCTRSYLEFQNVDSVLLPIDQRIIACQGSTLSLTVGAFWHISSCLRASIVFSIILSLRGPSRPMLPDMKKHFYR